MLWRGHRLRFLLCARWFISICGPAQSLNLPSQLFRAQIVSEDAHLATEGRKLEAMAKCMAAPVLQVSLPTPVPDEQIDADGQVASGRRGRTKKVQRYLLPVPVQPQQQDEQMQGDDDAQPSTRCETCYLGLLDRVYDFPDSVWRYMACTGAQVLNLRGPAHMHTQQP